MVGGGGLDWVASHPPIGEAKKEKHEKDWEYFGRNKGKNARQIPHRNFQFSGIASISGLTF